MNGTTSRTDSLPSFSVSSEPGLQERSPPAVLAPEQTEPNPPGPLGQTQGRYYYKTLPSLNTLFNLTRE